MLKASGYEPFNESPKQTSRLTSIWLYSVMGETLKTIQERSNQARNFKGYMDGWKREL